MMQQLAQKTQTQMKEAPLASRTQRAVRWPEHAQSELGQAVSNHILLRREYGAIQPKLVVGASDDQYEREADCVADAVMRMPEPAVQRQAEAGAEEEEEEPGKVQMKPVAEQITPLVQRQAQEDIPGEGQVEEEPIQTKPTSSERPHITAEDSTQIEALHGRGQPLPLPIRSFFEPRFRWRFDQVRVHTDEASSEIARRLNAKAFTLGSDIVFRADQYVLSSVTGRQLLAHELTHVVQQSGRVGLRTSMVDAIAQSPFLARQPISKRERLENVKRTPIAIVVYEADHPKHSGFFAAQAQSIAREIGAVRTPSSCHSHRSGQSLPVGAMGFKSRNAFPILRDAVKCMNRKIDVLHIVGHMLNGIGYDRASASALPSFLSSNAKVVFHGCLVLTMHLLLQIMLGKLGPGAELYAGKTLRDPGRPYGFYRVTLPAGADKLRVELLRNVKSILPEGHIRRWAKLQKTQTLRLLVARSSKPDADVPKDAAQVFAEVLNERLAKKTH